MNLVLAPDGRLRAIWRFAVGIVLVVFIFYFGAPMLASVFGAPGSIVFDLVYRFGIVFLLVGGFCIFLRSLDHTPTRLLPAMGLNGGLPAVRDAAIGWAIGFILVAFAVGVIVVTGHMSAMERTFTTRALRLQMYATFVLLAGAMGEELAFRGYPFQRLVESIGGPGATVVLSAMFGMAHLWNPGASFIGFCNTALVGALFCFAYLRTRALWLSWGLHFAWNFTLGAVFGLPVSGLNDFSLIIRSRTTGAAWLTGGDYGIEAGVAGTIVILLGFVLIAFLVPPREMKRVPEPEPLPEAGGPAF